MAMAKFQRDGGPKAVKSKDEAVRIRIGIAPADMKNNPDNVTASIMVAKAKVSQVKAAIEAALFGE